MPKRQGLALVWLLAAAFCAALSPHAMAQCQPVRRALVVGINTYSGTRPAAFRAEKPLVARLPIQGTAATRPFDNLDGAVNDANDFADLLESRDYDFPRQNVIRLLEAKATAQNILDTFQRHLVDASTCAGDVEVFFYSGHGSQIRNRYTTDEAAPDRFDQTLVPYDAADGVADIRSKELDRLYLAAARKGIRLTVVADSCQSGGLSRGARQFTKGKAAEPDRRYVVDPGPRDSSGKPILPTRLSAGIAHPVLLLAAAYETEEAKEDGDDQRPHGAFTAALLKQLQDHGPHQPIGAVFDDVKFAVGLTQPGQHPQIYGESRLQSDLFGSQPNSATGVVTRVKQMRADGSLLLDKGTLAGLYPGCKLAGPSGVRVTIREEDSKPTESVADVVAGSFTGNPQGMVFRLEEWVVPDRSALTIYYAQDGPARESLLRDAAVVRQLAAQGLRVVSDPTTPLTSGEARQVWWLDGSWRLLGPRPDTARDLGKSLDAEQLRALAESAPLYVNFPLPAKDAAELNLGNGTPNNAVRVQKQPDRSRTVQYVLAGRATSGGIEYAWLRPGVTEKDQAETNLPVRTDWVSAAADLRSKALALNRIYGWMTLEVPGGGTASGTFPYRLALRKTGASANLAPGRDVTVEGEQYKIWLTADAREVADIARSGRIARRWVYVIAIDRDGNTSVLIPAAESNTGNYLPTDAPPPAEIPLTSDPYDFFISPPFGLDTYILLTSEEELDPRIFRAEGVRSDRPSRGARNALADLLENMGASGRSRGQSTAVPANWSVQRITFRSQPRN